jgi:hypothetical protein
VGLAQARTANVDANAFVYVAPEPGAALGPGALSAVGDGASPRVKSVELLMRDVGIDWAVRFTFADADAASQAAGPAVAASAGADDWVDVAGAAVSTGRAASTPWGTSVREAWRSGDEALVSERFPRFWEQLRLMPADPPATPVAAGFVSNVADLVDRLLASGGTSISGLSDGLGLVRVGPIAFVGYSDALGPLPGAAGPSLLRDLDASVLFVAEGGYPGFVVGRLFGAFAAGTGLVQIDIDGESAFYRQVNVDTHLVVKNYGPTLYFAASPSRARAEALMDAVIRDQRRR